MYKKYLIYSTIFSIFTEAIFINVGFDLKFFYFVILVNSLLLLKLQAFRLNKMFVATILVVSISSFINVLLGVNTIGSFLMQLAGVFICGSYYYNFFYYINNPKLLFSYYLKLAIYVCYVGFPIYVINLVFFPNANIDHRFHSLLSEPAHYGAIMVPALYFYYKKYLSERKFKKELILLVVSILLTSSTVAFLGVILVVLLSSKINLVKLFLPSFLIMIFGLSIYNYNDNVKLRVGDTLNALTDFNVDGVNLSTYAIMSNFYVAKNNIEENPVIGTGLGSFELAHNKYINGLEGIEYMEVRDEGQYIGINKKDANSLFVRFAGELGLLGVFIILFFIFKNRLNVSDDILLYSNAVLCYILLKLFREGHYFSPEMWFFFTFYYIIPKLKNNNNERRYTSSYSYVRGQGNIKKNN